MDNKKEEKLIVQPVSLASKSLDKLYKLVKRLNGEFMKKDQEHTKKETI